MWLVLLSLRALAPAWAGPGAPPLDAACVVEPSLPAPVEDERASAIDALTLGDDGTAAACVPGGVLMVPRPGLHRPSAVLPLADCHALGALDGGRLVALTRHPTPALALVNAGPVAAGGAPAVLSALPLPRPPPAGVALALEDGVIWLVGTTGVRSPLARWDGQALAALDGALPQAPPASFPAGAPAPDGERVLSRRAIPTRPGWAEVVELRDDPGGAVQFERTLIGPDGRTHAVHELEDLVGRVPCLGAAASAGDQPARDLAPGHGATWVQMIPVSSCSEGERCVVFVWLQLS